MTCLCKSTFTVSVTYPDIYFILCQNTAEENEVYPGEFGIPVPDLYRSQNQACGLRLYVHLRPEDQAQRKVEETIGELSRESIHLLYNTK